MTPWTLRVTTVQANHAADTHPDLSASPLYLLAVLVAARRSKDNALERLTRRRLDRLGVRIAFGDDIPPRPEHAKGARRA